MKKINTNGLSENEEKAFLAVHRKIDRCFSAVPDKSLPVPFPEFELLSSYASISFRDALRITDGRGKACLSFIKVAYTYTGYKGAQRWASEYQIWAIAFLPQSFGHLIIKPETFKDRITELFQPLELKFPEDHFFSKRFFILAKDAEKARALLRPAFREELKRILLKDFYLEVKDDILLIGNKKIVSDEEALQLASFVFNVSELDFVAT